MLKALDVSVAGAQDRNGMQRVDINQINFIVSTAANYLMNFVIGEIVPIMLSRITFWTYIFFCFTSTFTRITQHCMPLPNINFVYRSYMRYHFVLLLSRNPRTFS